MMDETPRRRGARRGLWEMLIVTVLLGACYALWHYQEYRWQNRLDDRVAELETEHARRLGDLQQRLDAADAAEGAGVTRAFGVGIEPLAAEARWREVDAAVLELLALPGVSFVNVLDRDGGVLVSSDRKLLATGDAGPRAEWALGAEGLVQRVGASSTAGHEYALPLAGGDAVLWLGYGRPPAAEDPA